MAAAIRRSAGLRDGGCGRTPSGMFVAHAAAITAVYLAVVEHGPAAWIKVTGWLTDRAGWREWTRVGRWSSHPSRLTPDAVAAARR